MLACMIHSNPSSMPSTSTPSSAARIVAAPITELIPGAGPPPTRMARRLRWVMLTPLSGDRGYGEIARQLLHDVGGLLVPGLEQEVRAPAIRLVAEDEEVGLGVGEEVGAQHRRGQAIARVRAAQGGRQLVGRARRVALVDLQLPVERVVRAETGVDDHLVGLLEPRLLADA